jgi:hypothetical protein
MILQRTHPCKDSRMKLKTPLRRALIAGAGLATLLLAGCAHHHRHHPGPGDTRAQPDPVNPRVMVYDGQVSVDLEPLYFNRKAGKVTITWRLPADGPYAFADNGITIEPGDRETSQEMVGKEFQCQRVQATAFACVNHNTRKARFKYTVRVTDGGKALPPLDPVIVNTWD